MEKNFSFYFATLNDIATILNANATCCHHHHNHQISRRTFTPGHRPPVTSVGSGVHPLELTALTVNILIGWRFMPCLLNRGLHYYRSCYVNQQVEKNTLFMTCNSVYPLYFGSNGHLNYVFEPLMIFSLNANAMLRGECNYIIIYASFKQASLSSTNGMKFRSRHQTCNFLGGSVFA